MSDNADLPIIVGDDSREMLELGLMLAKAACVGQGGHVYPEDKEKLTLSPYFGPYVYKAKEKGLLIQENGISLQIPIPPDQLKEEFMREAEVFTAYLAGFAPEIWRWISYGLAMGCAAGGTKALIDLLKAWVEERKGRKIRIKQGEVEIEIQGGMSQKRIKEVVDLFEAKFGQSRIIQL